MVVEVCREKQTRNIFTAESTIYGLLGYTLLKIHVSLPAWYELGLQVSLKLIL